MKRDRTLWLTILAAPTIWFISFLANFALVPLACAQRWKIVLYAVSLAAIAGTLTSGFVAWSEWQHLGRQLPGEGGDPDSRARAMASGAVTLSAMFTLVIFAQTIVETLLEACQ